MGEDLRELIREAIVHAVVPVLPEYMGESSLDDIQADAVMAVVSPLVTAMQREIDGLAILVEDYSGGVYRRVKR